MKNKLIFITVIIFSVSVKAQLYAPNGKIEDSSVNNNVGIGTQTPQAKLSVQAGPDGYPTPLKAISIWGPNSPANANSAQDLSWDFAAAGSSVIRSYRGANFDTYMQFLTNSDFGGNAPQIRMHISQNGNIGIGNTTPAAKLDVYGTISSYEPLALGAAIKSFQLINQRSGNVGENTIINRLWAYRDGNLNNWYASRFHDGISVDSSFQTPNLDTKTWWERDPFDNIQSWGNNAETYLTINKGNVGIGTTNPLSKFEIAGGNLLVRNIANVDGVSSIMLAHSVNISDFDTTGTSIRTITQNAGGNNYALQFFTEDSYLVGQTEKLRIQGNGNVGIGITNPQNKLDVNGTIHSQEVKVDMTGWSDFVFKKEYSLPTLEQVEKHIAEKGHLENIPSEKEVLENGINLGEMNSKLLQKIEEMTLYIIDLKKENEKMKKENQTTLERQIDLERRINKIESK